jgi:uncharacterized protein YjbI with pentapeptide repeats
MKFTDRELIRSTASSPVYIILQGKRRHIPDPETFQYLGYLPPDVRVLPDSAVQSIPEGAGLPSLASRKISRPWRPIPKGAALSSPVTALVRRTTPAWLALLAIASLAIIGVVLVIVLPSHLIQIAGLTPTQRVQEISQTRGSLVQLIAGIAILLGLYFTLQSVQISRAALLATVENQLSERYAKSLELVKSSNTLEVRLGGILALERIAITSAADREPILDFLTTVLRFGSSPGTDGERSVMEVEAILYALSRIIEIAPSERVTDLRAIRITQVSVEGVSIASADLSAAVIENSTIMHSNLRKARIPAATLKDVDLRFSDMAELMGRGAVIINSDLSWSNLTDSVFIGADLRDTSFVGSELGGALMIGADLRGANLRHTDLRLVDLDDTLLAGAHADADTQWPTDIDPKAQGVSFGD